MIEVRYEGLLDSFVLQMSWDQPGGCHQPAEGVHTYMPCMLVAGFAIQLQGWVVKSVRVNSAFHPSGVGT